MKSTFKIKAGFCETFHTLLVRLKIFIADAVGLDPLVNVYIAFKMAQPWFLAEMFYKRKTNDDKEIQTLH